MWKLRYAGVVLVGLLGIGFAQAKEAVRIDASSDEAAQGSFRQMMEQLGKGRQKSLAVAVTKLNLTGSKNVYEVVRNPDLKSMGIARIKDKVSGLTAEEIIQLGDKVSDVRLQSIGMSN